MAITPERYKAHLEHLGDLFRAATAYEHVAMKPLLLLNGGALVAILAYFGAISKGPSGPIDLLPWRWPLFLWTSGLVFATLVAFLGYRSQLAFYHSGQSGLYALESKDEQDKQNHTENAKSHGKSGKRWRIGAEICGVFSLGCFVGGVYLAVNALVGYA